MFSRSDKTEEATEAMADPSAQRSPMVLAALAGLLAIAGAFLLVWYLSGGQDEVADGGEAAVAEADRQVLVVTELIPAGTRVQDLIDTPTAFLAARAVPEQFAAPTAITSIPELESIANLVLSSDALPGEQLLRGKFKDLADFDNDRLIDTSGQVPIPEGHHAMVVTLGATQALGGRFSPGEFVTVVGSFRVGPPGGDSFDFSTVVLNAVEVIDVGGTAGSITGQASEDSFSVGSAGQGAFSVTLAVEPHELTDLVFTVQYGTVYLATAIDGIKTNDPEEFPRAATLMNQIVGADGDWLKHLGESNVIDLTEIFAGLNVANGESIDVEIPEQEEENDGSAEAAPASDDTEAEPGDS